MDTLVRQKLEATLISLVMVNSCPMPLRVNEKSPVMLLPTIPNLII